MIGFLKRIFDFLFSLIALVLLTPFFVLLALILMWTGEGDVFYVQTRVGKNAEEFGILKFATMLRNSANLGNKNLTVRDDFRITKFGRILRRTKINELPQIFNILKGEMSFVGPRPLVPASFSKYPKAVQEIISKSIPGVTGIGSLVFRDEEKLVSLYTISGGLPLDYYHQYIYPYKAELEKWYYLNKSFKTDFIIILLTAYSLINSKSQIVYKFFKTLPKKPAELFVENIPKLVKP